MSVNAPIDIDGQNPQRFEEAVAWFGDQAPWVSGSSWSYMAALAARKGDQISGTTLLSVVDSVFKEMDRALADGRPYGEFLRELGPRLDQQWYEVDSPRMDLIWRNNVGGALMAGRLRQMEDPEVRAARPYLLFDGIEDWRQSEICAARDGMIMLSDDPRWASNTPLLHHNCRSGLVTLDEEEAREMGGTSPASMLASAPSPGTGWGSPNSWRDWEPDPATYAPALYDEFKKWTEGAPYVRSRAEWEEAVRRQVQTALPEGARLPVDVPLPRRPEEPGRLPPIIPIGGSRPEQAPERDTADEARKRQQLVREYMDAWVVGSGSKKSVTLKTAAREALGLPGIVYSRRDYNIRPRDVEELRPAVAQIYEDTQAALQNRFPDGYVRLYRGVKTPPAVRLVGVLESWTTDLAVAEAFAGRRRMRKGQPGSPIEGKEEQGEILYYEIPISSIFSFSGGPNWVNGKYGEQKEFVVLGSRVEGQRLIEVL